MSNTTPNPVQNAATALPKASVPYGRMNRPMALRQLDDGTYAQVVFDLLGAQQAQVNIDSRAALTTALRANTVELSEQNDLQAASNEHTAELGSAVVTLNNSILAGNALQTTRNQMATTTNNRLQTLIDSNGTVNASVQAVVSALAGNLKVTGTFWQATQPVSAVSLPLPTGAATETTLTALLNAVKGTLAVSGFPATQAVSATAWPLPAGAATETTSAAILAKLNGSVAVTGTFWPATQPVSGTFWQAVQPVSATALPLPAGAATDATLGPKLDAILAATQANADKPRVGWVYNNGALSGGGTATLGQAGANGARLMNVVATQAALLGVLGLSTATVTLFHTNSTNTSYVEGNANSVLVMPPFVINGNTVLPIALGIDIPAGRYLRVTVNSGNFGIVAVVRQN